METFFQRDQQSRYLGVPQWANLSLALVARVTSIAAAVAIVCSAACNSVGEDCLMGWSFDYCTHLVDHSMWFWAPVLDLTPPRSTILKVSSGHQNQRPSAAAIEGVMKERTMSVSTSRPIPIVIPS